MPTSYSRMSMSLLSSADDTNRVVHIGSFSKTWGPLCASGIWSRHGRY